MKTTLQRVGHYQLQQRVGRDIASEVWRAYDTDGQRSVILKLYRTVLPYDDASLAHYVRNVEHVASLHHPNIVPIYDIQLFPSRSSDGSLVYLVMEDSEGTTLADYIESSATVGKIPPPTDIVFLFSSLAQAIDHAHRHGIIHGNLKPGNILLKQRIDVPDGIGTPLLTDFGPTKVPMEKQGNNVPLYLAPEQIKNAPADERSDIYTLGILLYELYTGMPPFRGNRPIAVMMQHINAQPTPPDLVNPAISPALAQVILRCLAKVPQDRFPNAASLTVALTQALHMPVPEDLRRSVVLSEERRVFTTPLNSQSPPPPATESGTTRRTIPLQSNAGSLSTTHLARPSISQRKRKSSFLVIVAMITLTLLLGAIFGTLLLAQRESTASAQGAGQVFFISSGQVNGNSDQRMNDELQIELSNIPDPAAGKSYYAWLLGDIGQTEASPIFLGRVTVAHGTGQFLYMGDSHHTNLLGLASRFLITEDNAHAPSSDPLLDQSIWRYYAAIPQTPNPADVLHFSLLDHLRHLLVESPELAIRGLHGGLAFWFVKDTAMVSDLSNTLAADWQKKDANDIHTQIIRMLDYLDGASSVATDVPPGTPLLAEAQIALLGPAPQNADPPGYVYQNEAPPGYVYLIQMHLNGAVLAPQTTAEQHQIAIHINGGIDTVKQSLGRVYQDAKQLVDLTNTQLLQPSTLAMLNDMATQAHVAYNGQSHVSTGASPGSAVWIYDNLQRLATFDVAPYTAPKP
jgi:eukaryotic-like serine/threonine-protein kinase